MRAIFLDRDGVINKYPGDFQYVESWGGFSFLPGIIQALKKLNESGFEIFVISNQAGVSKGVYSQESLDLITGNMLKELSSFGVRISGVYYCIHNQEENCSCRKPNTGLVDKAVSKLKKEGKEIEFSRSFFVGDTVRDVETGKKAGLKTILLFSGKEKPGNESNWQLIPDFTASDLSEAVDLILKS